MARPFFLVLGIICVALGVAGAFLPLLPTTPFLLIALWAFGRSSPRLANWLRYHPRLGGYVRDWENQRAIPLKAKFLALAMMAGSLAWLIIWTEAPVAVKTGVSIILAGVAVFIATRPNGVSGNAGG